MVFKDKATNNLSYKRCSALFDKEEIANFVDEYLLLSSSFNIDSFNDVKDTTRFTYFFLPYPHSPSPPHLSDSVNGEDNGKE